MTKPAAFWDASALVPCCVPQAVSSQARAQLLKFDPVVWWASTVEVHSAVSRVLRAGYMNARDADGAFARLQKISRGWREVLPDESLRDLACQLVAKYPLRAADSMQLAAALVWCQQRPHGRTFICGDQRLSDAARAAGFSVIEI